MRINKLQRDFLLVMWSYLGMVASAWFIFWALFYPVIAERTPLHLTVLLHLQEWLLFILCLCSTGFAIAYLEKPYSPATTQTKQKKGKKTPEKKGRPVF